MPSARLIGRRRLPFAVTLLLGATALSLFAGAFLAPVASMEAATPDFSGTWIYVPPAPPSAGREQADPRARIQPRPPTGLCATECTIVQRAGALTVTRLGRDEAPTTYRLDGLERRSQQRHPVSTAGFEVATRAVWEGATLAVSSTAAAPHAAQMRMTLALVDDWLVIDTRLDKDGRITAHRLTYRRAGE